MKKIIPILTILLLSIAGTNAQDKFSIELKTEGTFFTPKFHSAKYKDITIEENEGYTSAEINFSASLSARLLQQLYLKTTIGSNNFEQMLDISGKRSTDTQYSYRGKLYHRLTYLEVLPEVRFKRDTYTLFGNSGMGVSRMHTTEKLKLTSNRTPIAEAVSTHLALNAGGIIHVSKIGLLLEIGYKVTLGVHQDMLDSLIMRYQQWSLKAGVSYQL